MQRTTNEALMAVVKGNCHLPDGQRLCLLNSCITGDNSTGEAFLMITLCNSLKMHSDYTPYPGNQNGGGGHNQGCEGPVTFPSKENFEEKLFFPKPLPQQKNQKV